MFPYPCHRKTWQWQSVRTLEQRHLKSTKQTTPDAATPIKPYSTHQAPLGYWL